MKSMRDTFLPFARPSISEEELEAVVDSLKSGWLTTGPKTREFEEEFANYVGAKHAIAVNSCTAALHLSLVGLDIGPGHEVITTPLTFCSTVNVIVHQGATPVLCDIEPETYNLDPGLVEEAIGENTKAVIPVHYAGLPCDMERIADLARENRLDVIEDAAHAAGSRYSPGDRVGSCSNSRTACFSFYAIKNLTTGEGGMVTTNDTSIAERIRLNSLHGISKDAWNRYTAKGSWYYEVVSPGFKYNMTDIQAALGLVQLKRLEQFIATRTEYSSIYDEVFSDMDEVVTPPEGVNSLHSRHLYPIRILTEKLTIDRNNFIEELRRKNIGTSVNFIPVHLHPYYRTRFGWKPGDFPVAEKIFEGLVSLPLYPAMTRADVQYVARSVRDIVTARSR
jgi:dTDP-4-amino-4,6-dideoxygalactose transaminase